MNPFWVVLLTLASAGAMKWMFFQPVPTLAQGAALCLSLRWARRKLWVKDSAPEGDPQAPLIYPARAA